MAEANTRVALVTGATGYIGGQLTAELIKDGWAVKALSRDRDKALKQNWGKKVLPAGEQARPGMVEIIEGEMQDRAALQQAMEGVDVAWYLVHSMSAGAEFREQDRKMAQNFGEVAYDSGVGRIVYLSGLHPAGGELSDHLASRVEVGELLMASGVPTAVLQAGIVIGDGSESFALLRHVAERLPGIIGPAWMENKVSPISIRDALYYLKAAADLPAEVSRTFDIGSHEEIPYKEMIRRYAEYALKIPRVTAIAPIMNEKIASHGISLVTPLSRNMALPLIQSLQHDTVVKERDIEQYAGVPAGGVQSFERAVGEAIKTVDTGLWMKTFAGVSAAVVGTAVAGSLMTDPDNRWYRNLRKPAFQPPAPVFPIVWTVLYGHITCVSALVIADDLEKAREGHESGAREAKSYVAALGANLALNAGWSGLFFRSRKPWVSTAEAGLLAASSLDLVRRAYNSAPERGVALAPYGAWTSFAVFLNGTIARMNRSRTPLQKFYDQASAYAGEGAVLAQKLYEQAPDYFEKGADLARSGAESLNRGVEYARENTPLDKVLGGAGTGSLGMFAARKGLGVALKFFPPYVVAQRGFKIYRTVQRGRKLLKKYTR